jgi:hypothetical protein
VGPTACLKEVARQNFLPVMGTESQQCILQPTTILTELSLLSPDLLNILTDKVSCVAIKTAGRVYTYFHKNVVLCSLLQTWGQDQNILKFLFGFLSMMCQPFIFCWYGTAIIHNVSQNKLEHMQHSCICLLSSHMHISQYKCYC